MQILDALILGIVEGITEFLPVSSTGHLILTSELLGLQATEFLKTFEIAIQLGAMCAVVVLYFRSFFEIEIIKRLVIAFIPTGIVGFTVYPFIKGALFDNALVVVVSLFVGGILLILFELWHREAHDAVQDVRTLSYTQSALIGLAQAVAVIPGVSRSGATILGGLMLGISRTAIVEFSFLLAVPTIAAATGLDVLKSYESITAADLAPLCVGFVVSFIVALISIKFLLDFVRRRSFIAFGIYRIAVAVLFFAFVL
jgi:undecaprenyl-diphosphatase